MLNNINIKNNIIQKIKEKISKKEQEIKSAYKKMTKINNIFYLSTSFILIFEMISLGLFAIISNQPHLQNLPQSFSIFFTSETLLFLSIFLFLSFKENRMNKKLFNQELCLINFLKNNHITFNKEEKEYFLEYIKDEDISSNSNVFNFLNRLEQNNYIEKEKIKLLKSSHIDMQYNFLEAK